MKKLVLIACLALGVQVQAQYFNHDYGGQTIEEPQRGMNTTMNHEGFIISGLVTNTTSGATGTIVAYSDKNGNLFGAPYFVKGFRVRTPNNVPMNSRDGKVLELNSVAFGVAGTASYNVGSSTFQYVYWIAMDSNGTAGPVKLYNTNNTSFYGVNSVAHAVSTAAVYITGWAQVTTTGEFQPFVMKITYNGTILWSHTYDIDPTAVSTDMGYDIVEDPTSGDLVLVGKTNYNGSDDGFVMQLNPTNGAVIGMNIYGSTSSAEYFTCITPSNDAANNYGFIVGGNTDNTTGGDLDGWLMRLDNTYTTLWSNKFDYDNNQVTNYFADVVERLDSSGTYMAYAGGTTVVGNFGSGDMEVDRVESATGTARGQYTYGDAGSNVLVSIDQRSTGTLGISMFGSRSPGYLGSNDLNIFKAYFNGITYCNDSLDSIAATSTPDYITNYSPDSVYRFVTYTGSVTTQTGFDKTVCAGSSAAGGSNRMQWIEEAAADEVFIQSMPQPASYMVHINKSKAGSTLITVNDMYGRMLYSQKATLQSGENIIPLDLSKSSFSSGMYVINVTDGKIRTSKKISILK